MCMEKKGPADSTSHRPSNSICKQLVSFENNSTLPAFRLVLIRDTTMLAADFSLHRLARALHTLGVGVGAKVGQPAAVLKILNEGGVPLGRQP